MINDLFIFINLVIRLIIFQNSIESAFMDQVSGMLRIIHTYIFDMGRLIFFYITFYTTKQLHEHNNIVNNLKFHRLHLQN